MGYGDAAIQSNRKGVRRNTRLSTGYVPSPPWIASGAMTAA